MNILNEAHVEPPILCA